MLIPFFIYITPLLIIIYWFWVGTEFTEDMKSPVLATITANSMGIVCAALYYWQFIILNDEKRNLFLAGFSQMFTAPLNYITAKIVYIFGAPSNEITDVTTLSMELIGLILMILVFLCGYLYKKRSMKTSC